MKNQGFTLIETILYTALLSIIMLGIFSSIMNFLQFKINSKAFSEEEYDLLIINFHE